MSDEGRVSPATGAQLVPLGQLPPLGEVPDKMTALVVRPDRYGEPQEAFVREELEVPKLGHGEVLVAVMAAGVNYNNVWAARGYPVDIIAMRRRQGEEHDFHIGGSDASGIIYAVGEGVDHLEVGDHVVVHPGYWDEDDPWIADGGDPMIAPSARIWGYDTNFGAFAQFARAQSHQIMPKAPQLSWEEAAAPTLVGTTAYRMLHGWPGNTVQEDDVVLVWGGSGGLGTQATQLARAAGALPIAVVSSEERGNFALEYGAHAYIDRTQFDHWGRPPHIDDTEGQRQWSESARAFGKTLWNLVGGRRDPAIVFEHPGEATIPTSVFLCEPGGMVVICAGTTGFEAVVDLRYHWTRQKRLQGSHGTNDEQARAYNQLIIDGVIDPVLGSTVPFDSLPSVHDEMGRGENVFGNVVALVGASEPGMGRE